MKFINMGLFSVETLECLDPREYIYKNLILGNDCSSKGKKNNNHFSNMSFYLTNGTIKYVELVQFKGTGLLVHNYF